MRQLLVEYAIYPKSYSQGVIQEEAVVASPKKSYYVEGPMMQADVVNRNGRSYPLRILIRECLRYVKEMVSRNRGVGEMDHPNTPNINPGRISHKIVSIRQDGNNFIGKARVTNTAMGRAIKELMDEGIELAFSSRGLGSLKKVGKILEVQDDFHLITPADIVYDPSGPDCWAEAIIEGKGWAFNDDDALYGRSMTEINNTVTTSGINEEKLMSIFESVLKGSVDRTSK